MVKQSYRYFIITKMFIIDNDKIIEYNHRYKAKENSVVNGKGIYLC